MRQERQNYKGRDSWASEKSYHSLPKSWPARQAINSHANCTMCQSTQKIQGSSDKVSNSVLKHREEAWERSFHTEYLCSSEFFLNDSKTVLPFTNPEYTFYNSSDLPSTSQKENTTYLPSLTLRFSKPVMTESNVRVPSIFLFSRFACLGSGVTQSLTNHL